MRLFDGLVNALSRMGDPTRDKAAGAAYVLRAQDKAQLYAAYQSSALIRRAIDLPAEDATREWRGWQAEADDIGLLEAEEDRLALRSKVVEARRLARLFGGAAIYASDGGTDPAQPLDPARIGKGGLRYIAVLGSDVLTAGEVDRDIASPTFGRPKVWRVSTGDRATVDVHPTRLSLFHGVQPLLDGFGTYAPLGWGDSALHGMLDALRRVEEVAANSNSLVYEAKVDVLRIAGLMQGFRDYGAAYETSLQSRLLAVMQHKGIHGTLVADKDDEYDQKSASFGGLPEIMDRFMQLASAASGVPVSILFGRSAAGLNATGEMDVRAYYDRVKVEQELHVTPAMQILDECLIRSALGRRPPEVHYNWNPLWQPDDKEVAEIGRTLAETLKIGAEMNAASPEALGATYVNALTEAGVFPGLEGAAEEFPLLSPDETDPGEDGNMPPPDEPEED